MILNWLRKIRHRRKGEQIIYETLLTMAVRKIVGEIDSILNLKLAQKGVINRFQSSTGLWVLFYIDATSPESYQDCEIYPWDEDLWDLEKIKFKRAASKKGITKTVTIQAFN